MKNPKSHDALFKWLIATFITDFFDHYFPSLNVKIGKDPFLDKEFISKYEALKASLEGDLFIIVEVEIDGQLFDVVVHIETQSSKKDMSFRVFEYLCYAWLLKQRPVWSIVFYTDDIARAHSGYKRNFTGQHFWARGYFVSTVGKDEEAVRKYIQNQEKEDRRVEQLTLFK